MLFRAGLVVVVSCLVAGCLHPKAKMPVINQVIAPYDQFVAKNFDWSTIRRIVVVPLANQTPYPRVSFEMQSNLAAEMQRAGRFEIVTATREDEGARAQDVFASGQFNEMDVLRIAREHQADAVLFANVTQYHPYTRPRIGLQLLLVSPAEGIAIASASGLWDAREATTSAQAQAYFRQTQNFPRSLLGNDRVFESPDVYQRFVCQQVAASFSPPGDCPGTINPMVMPAEMVMPVETGIPNGTELSPLPPPPIETQ